MTLYELIRQFNSTAFSVGHAAQRYATCARVMGIAADNAPNDTACAALVDALRELNADLKVPKPSDLGHHADDAMLSLMADQALASGSPQNNPRIPTADEIISLYRASW